MAFERTPVQTVEPVWFNRNTTKFLLWIRREESAMPRVENEQRVHITEDITRMCSICRDLGFLGALADEYYHDSTGSDIADAITEYITELFNAKRGEGHE